MEVVMKPVGFIKSPYESQEEIPRQSIYSLDKTGVIELEEALIKAIEGYEVGDYIVVLFNFHKSNFQNILINPHGGDRKVGVFKTRSPNRPNPIGMSIVEIVGLEEGKIHFRGVDMLNGTPVLDIKPYSKNLNPEEN